MQIPRDENSITSIAAIDKDDKKTIRNVVVSSHRLSIIETDINLEGYYKLNEASYNGTTGEVKDSSGNAINGVRVGNTTTIYDEEEKKMVATFNGNGDGINLGANYKLGTDNFSLRIKFKTIYNGTGNNNSLIQTRGTGTSVAAGYQFWIPDGQIKFLIANGTTGETKTAGIVGQYNDGKWHEVIVLVKREDYIKIYVDGILKTNLATTLTGSIESVLNCTIGGILSGGVIYHGFAGRMSNVILYKGILPEIESTFPINALRDENGVPTKLGTEVGERNPVTLAGDSNNKLLVKFINNE